MDLPRYRNSPSEKNRIADLMGLLPKGKRTVLDIGARDGFLAVELTRHFASVTALDLETPEIRNERVACVAGDATDLQFDDASFDLVFCAEVLEHIPPPGLEKACSEISRTASEYILIGVPYRQDLRVGRTTCYTCGKKNPPWGHVNRFDESRLERLFPGWEVAKTSYVGETDAATNAVSCLLMDFAGNPYGTYVQEETCVHCGAKLKNPPQRNFLQKLLTKAAFWIDRFLRIVPRRHANWIHILFKSRTAQA